MVDGREVVDSGVFGDEGLHKGLFFYHVQDVEVLFELFEGDDEHGLREEILFEVAEEVPDVAEQR